MAGNDAYRNKREQGTEPGVAERRAFGALRAILVQPQAVHLWTNPATGERWLTDRYVLAAVTGVVVDGKADGTYRLQAGAGLIASAQYTAPDTGALLAMMEDEHPLWARVHATQWAVADSAARIMLVWADAAPKRWPFGMNEGVWTAFTETRGADVLFEKDPDRPSRPFRVRAPGDDGELVTIAYVAPARLPEDQLAIAQLIIEAQ